MGDSMLRDDSRQTARSAREGLHKAFSESVARFESAETAKFGALQERIARLDAGPPIAPRQTTTKARAAHPVQVRQGRDKLAGMNYQEIKSFCNAYASKHCCKPCQFKGCGKLGCAEHCLAEAFKRSALKRRCEKEGIAVTTAKKGGARQRQTLAVKLYERAVDKAAQAVREQRRPPRDQQQEIANALREARVNSDGVGTGAGIGAGGDNRGRKRKSAPAGTSAPCQSKRRHVELDRRTSVTQQ